MAEGVYYPDEGGSHVDNEVSESFRIERDNVQLYGGFGGYGIIDGFTVTAGSASGNISPNNQGGGLHCAGNASGRGCSPALANIIFSGNQAVSQFGMGDGGGMYNNGAFGVSSLVLTNVTFRGNQATNQSRAGNGGGM